MLTLDTGDIRTLGTGDTGDTGRQRDRGGWIQSSGSHLANACVLCDSYLGNCFKHFQMLFEICVRDVRHVYHNWTAWCKHFRISRQCVSCSNWLYLYSYSSSKQLLFRRFPYNLYNDVDMNHEMRPFVKTSYIHLNVKLNGWLPLRCSTCIK